MCSTKSCSEARRVEVRTPIILIPKRHERNYPACNSVIHAFALDVATWKVIYPCMCKVYG